MLTRTFFLTQGDQLVNRNKLGSSTSKTKIQTEPTSFRHSNSRENNGISKIHVGSGSNGYLECITLEKPPSLHNKIKGQSNLSFPKIEEEDRSYGNATGTKRVHIDISSPNMKSPISTEDNTDAPSHGFVSARAKLVRFVLAAIDCKFCRDPLFYLFYCVYYLLALPSIISMLICCIWTTFEFIT